MPRLKKIKRTSDVDYSTGPAYSATSMSRQAADTKYDRIGGNASGLDSKLVLNPDGTYTRKSVDSSPAEMTKGKKMKVYKKGGKSKKKGKRDACYHKVRSRYKVWPSAYASGALVRCRKVGAANWGNKSKKR